MTHVLVVAAHPDDAEIGVGGSIAHLTSQGVAVTVALGTVSESPGMRGRRISSAERAAAVLGHKLRWLGDGRYDQVEDVPEYQVVTWVDELVAEVDPSIVITHWDRDSHADHVRVARAVMASSRRWPQTSLLQFGPAEHRTTRHTEFVPNIYVPIGDHLERKLDALRQYEYPGQGFRLLNTAAVEVFARACGMAVDVNHAEGLRLVRHRVGNAVSGLL